MTMTTQQAAGVLRKFSKWFPSVAEWDKEVHAAIETAIAVMEADIKVCKGCGHRSDKRINQPALSCCPDSNYIPLDDYLKGSVYKGQATPPTEITLETLYEISDKYIYIGADDKPYLSLAGAQEIVKASLPAPPTDEQIGEVFDEYADFPAFQQPSMTRTASIRFAKALFGQFKSER